MRQLHSARFHCGSAITCIVRCLHDPQQFYSGDESGRVCWWRLTDGEPPKLIGELLLDSAIQSIVLTQMGLCLILTRDGWMHTLRNGKDYKSIHLMPQLSFVSAKLTLDDKYLLIPHDDIVFGFNLSNSRFAFFLGAELAQAGQARCGTVMKMLPLKNGHIVVAYESGWLCEFQLPHLTASATESSIINSNISMFEQQLDNSTDNLIDIRPVKSFGALSKTPITDICLIPSQAANLHLVCVGACPQISVVDLKEARIERTVSTKNVHANCVSVRQSGDIMAVGGWDGDVRIYSIREKVRKLGKICHGQTAAIRHCDFHGNRRLLISAADGVIAIYEP